MTEVDYFHVAIAFVTLVVYPVVAGIVRRFTTRMEATRLRDLGFMKRRKEVHGRRSYHGQDQLVCEDCYHTIQSDKTGKCVRCEEWRMSKRVSHFVSIFWLPLAPFVVIFGSALSLFMSLKNHCHLRYHEASINAIQPRQRYPSTGSTKWLKKYAFT